MKKLLLAASALAAVAAATPALAAEGDTAGSLNVKLLGTAVLPDGKIDKINAIAPALAANPAFANADTKASDNYVPTIAIEYFFTDAVSAETICCTTAHHVTGTGSAAGAELVDKILVIPATVTVKYHLGEAGGARPYIGAGPTFFLMADAKPGSTAKALGVTDVDMSSRLGVAVQAGIEVPLQNGLGLVLDAKKYWVSTRAKFYAGGTKVLDTTHKLDPWVLSAGLSYRF